MENELVSILIPVYNRVSLVGETIESAINQTYKNIEIIIVDNHSTDGTWSLLQNYAAKDNRIRIFKNVENVGPVLNWKRCIDEANGLYAKILFSDDLISNNFIENTLAKFDLQTAFVISEIEIFDNNTSWRPSCFSIRNEYSSKEYLKDVLLDNLYVFPNSPGCALFRTADLKSGLVIDIPNAFNLEFKKNGAGNDLLLFLNTALNYKKVEISKRAVAYFRSHNNSFTISSDLTNHYNFTKYYFIDRYIPSYLSKFKVLLWFRSKRGLKKEPVFELIKEKKNFLFLIVYIAKIISNKLQRYFCK